MLQESFQRHGIYYLMVLRSLGMSDRNDLLSPPRMERLLVCMLRLIQERLLSLVLRVFWDRKFHGPRALLPGEEGIDGFRID